MRPRPSLHCVRVQQPPKKFLSQHEGEKVINLIRQRTAFLAAPRYRFSSISTLHGLGRRAAYSGASASSSSRAAGLSEPSSTTITSSLSPG